MERSKPSVIASYAIDRRRTRHDPESRRLATVPEAGAPPRIRTSCRCRRSRGRTSDADSGDVGRCTEGCLASSRTVPPTRDCVSIVARAGSRVSKYARNSRDATVELLATPLAGPDESIAASQQQPVVRCPTRIVVRSLGVPHHHVREAEITALSGAHRFGRQDVGSVHPKSSSQRPKLGRGISCRDHHAICLNQSVTRPNTDAIASGIDAPHSRSVRTPVRLRRWQRPGCPHRLDTDRTAHCHWIESHRRPEMPVIRRRSPGLSHFPPNPDRARRSNSR